MNFEAILEGYLTEGTQEMQHQIEFLIKQINSTDTVEEVDSDTEDGDDDEEVCSHQPNPVLNLFEELIGIKNFNFWKII